MDGLLAFLGFAGLAALILVPLTILFILGARQWRARHPIRSTQELFEVDPKELVKSLTRFGPK
jgi:hypothetical protein